MKNLVIRILKWLAGVELVPVDRAVLDVIPAAKVLVIQMSAHGQSGEWKRHQVLAKLMKAGASERDAALAIELAVREEIV